LVAIGLALVVLLCAPVYASSISCSNPGTGSQSSSATFIDANSCVDFSSPVQGANNWYYGYYTAENLNGVVNPNSEVNPPILDPKTFTEMTPTPLLGSNGQILPGQYLGVWSQNFFQYWTSLDAYGGHSNGNYTDLHPINTAPGEPWVWVPGANSYCNFTGTVYYNCSPIGGYDPENPNSPDDGNYWAARRYEVPSGFSGDVTIDLSTQRQTDSLNSQGYTDYVILDANGVSTILNSITVSGNAPTTQVFNLFATADVSPGDFIDFVIVPQYDTFKLPGQAANSGYADFSSGQYQLDTISSGGGQIVIGVPEPGTVALMGSGLLLLGFARRRLFGLRRD
jgi:hypothetical protein